MMVKVLLQGERVERVADLLDCFGDDEDGYSEAREELERTGRFWLGGGAAPLFLLQRVG